MREKGVITGQSFRAISVLGLVIYRADPISLNQVRSHTISRLGKQLREICSRTKIASETETERSRGR